MAGWEASEREGMLLLLSRIALGASEPMQWAGFDLCTKFEHAADGRIVHRLYLTAGTMGSGAWFQQKFKVTRREGEVCELLLKGLSEVRAAPIPIQAAEMVMVRFAYAAELPTPADAIKTLESGGGVPVRTSAPAPSNPGPRASFTAVVGSAAPARAPMAEPVAQPTAVAAAPAPESFAAVVALFESKREAMIAAHLRRHVHLVRFESGVIEFNPDKGAPKDLAGQTGKLLSQWTGARWVVSVANAAGEPTLHDQEHAAAKADPLIQSILDAFPGAVIETVRKADK